MKLSKRVWIILAIGIFVIAFAGINMAYSKQDEEQSRLNEELSLAQLRLTKQPSPQLSSRQTELESQLAQLETQLKNVKGGLFQSIESIEATHTLFNAAETCGVEIIEISSLGLTSKELEGLPCSVLTLTAKAEGEVSKLISFILKLSEEFPTGVVETVEIDVPEVTEEEEETEKPSANFKLCIHTYEGD